MYYELIKVIMLQHSKKNIIHHVLKYFKNNLTCDKFEHQDMRVELLKNRMFKA